MTWTSDPRTAGMLLSQAAHRHDGEFPSALTSRVATLRKVAPFLADDAAMFIRTAADFGGQMTEGVAGQCAWLDACIEDPGVLRDLWTDHRGALLYVLECAAITPAAWGNAAARDAISAILALGRRECAEGVPLRAGISFLVVETFADALSDELTRDPDSALLVATSRARQLVDGPWPDARRSAEAWRAARSRPEQRLLLGVPFEVACPPPWAPAIDALARAFRSDTAIDVNLYDSHPLAVAVCALASGEAAPGEVELLAARQHGWDAVVRAALDAWSTRG